MPFFWIGNQYELTDKPKCHCRRKPCSHFAAGNKMSRRMLRAKAKRQNSKFGTTQHKLWDEYARLAPRPGLHPAQRRAARMTRHGFGLVQPRRTVNVAEEMVRERRERRP